MVILKLVSRLLIMILPVAVLFRDWKNYGKRTKKYQDLTRNIIILWIIVGIFVVIDNSYENNRRDAKLDTVIRMIGQDNPSVKNIETTDESQIFSSSDPKTIRDLGKLVMVWGDQYGGSRKSYEILLAWGEKESNPLIKNLLDGELKNIKNTYKSDVMGAIVEEIHAVSREAKPPWSEGKEPKKGFNAQNVITHLTRDLWTERARAARLLYNIRTSPDKKSVNKTEAYNTLTNLMKESEPSLVVSRMALKTYSELTEFKPLGVFDFERAIEHWEENKEEILKKDF